MLRQIASRTLNKKYTRALLNQIIIQSSRSVSTANLPDTDPVIYHDDLITTENIMRKLDELLADGESKNYKSKHEMTHEEFEAQLKEQMNRPVFYDEEYINFITKTLDFSKEEVEEVVKGQEPKFYKKSDDGDLEVDWIEFARLFQRTETEKTLLPQFEREFKEMKQFKLELAEEAHMQQVTIDWADWEKRLGPGTVQKIKRDMDKVIEKTRPRIEIKTIQDKLDELMKPVLGQMKDDMVDALPLIKQVTDELVRETPLLKKDENGLYQQYLAPWFIDKYYPEERDQLIQEIEEDEYDVEYINELKATRLNPDEILLRNKDWIIKESSKIEEEEYRSMSSKSATMSAKKREEQNLYHGVIDGARRVKELESEVASLRASSESQAEEAKEGAEKKEEKLAMSEDEWWAFLATFGVDKNAKQKRDFSHFKSEQQLKAWEEGGEKARLDAEQTFFKTERLGK
ncbi:hypothetical protein FDP41_011089 [Naegleria fowleri]|uniref:Uncharacterized protein n=1 Tax=Naegleria fowleri TaxID=5763 RepID=A0A6A5C7K3_NAEFO|nr:uncharacterized protein FDP41_011655 [Naegleria fowleri]XP_044567824.1 uncharacterized protein FDP41_011089 [Naegleria fowleri]KAF0982250.1 hypothetical protein FDP41_011655 [Naegleria fowleri]KAF0983111.1 hypothetical protein FDP41_011089 [Naegleria fowleri]